MKIIVSIILTVTVFFSGCNSVVNSKDDNSNQPNKKTITTLLTYPYFENIFELEEKSTDIVMGRIIDIRVEPIDIRSKVDTDNEFLNPGGNEDEPYTPYIFTVFTLQVGNVYKGSSEIGDSIEIKQLGGETEDVIYATNTQLDLDRTHDYVFFLKSYETSPASILNPIQGAYIFNDKAGGVSDSLVSVSSDNDLKLTYSDLNEIATKNSSSTQRQR